MCRNGRQLSKGCVHSLLQAGKVSHGSGAPPGTIRPKVRVFRPQGLKLQMRHTPIVMMAFIAGIIDLGALSHVAPEPILEATAWDVAGGMS
jgi:hypothetical protein